MGKNGSDVAREAAAIVLMDDNFASIVSGIREGRLLFDNLKKTIAYTITHLCPEVFPVIFSLLIGFPAGISSLLILFIDLLTEQPPAISLAYENIESDIMRRPPRHPTKDRLVSIQILSYAYLQVGLIETAGCLLSYFLIFQHYHVPIASLSSLGTNYFLSTSKTLYLTNGLVYDAGEQVYIIDHVQSAWFLFIVVGQFFHIWNCRTRFVSIFEHGLFTNKYTNIGVVLEVIILVIIIYTLPGHFIAQSMNVPGRYFYAAIFLCGTIFLYCEVRKLICRTFPNSCITKCLAW
jgi:sodium/potassium-transporting ATPase subunit alpha